jgi:dolichyl-phosphate-mannose--protein O-mannosyl transferase
MRVEFQRTLFNNTNYDPLAPRPSVFTTFQQLNREMLAANARIELRHNWESLWWEWPLNLRGLLYYSKDNSADGSRNVVTTQTVYLLGNPAVIWLVGALVATTFASSAFYLRYKHFRGSLGNCDWLSARMATFSSATGYCLWVYVLNLLPYILVNRSAFIYHYMPALMYGEVMSALMVEQLVGKKNMPLAMKLIMGVVLASFCYYAPWVYAFPLTSEGHARRRLLKRWD